MMRPGRITATRVRGNSFIVEGGACWTKPPGGSGVRQLQLCHGVRPGVGIDVLVHDNGGCLGGHDCEGGSCAQVWVCWMEDAQLLFGLAKAMSMVMVYEVGRHPGEARLPLLEYASRNAVRPS